MATKKISNFTASSAPGLHWLIPFGETDLTNFAVRYDDFQKYFGQDGATVSIGDYTPDSSVILNVYSADRGLAVDVNYFSVSGINTGNIYAGSGMSIRSPNIAMSGDIFSVYGASTLFTGNTYAGNYASSYNLTANEINLSSVGNVSISSLNFNVTATNEAHLINQNFILQKDSVNFFSSSLTGSHFLPTLGFSVRASDPAGKIDLYANTVEITGFTSFAARVGGHNVFLDEDGIYLNSTNAVNINTSNLLSVSAQSATFSISTGNFNSSAIENHNAKAYRFIGGTGWQSNIPFYFESNNNSLSDAFYFYSESGKFRTATNDLSLKAFSSADISGSNMYLRGGSVINLTNEQSLFNINGIGTNLKANINIDSDGDILFQGDGLTFYQNALTVFTDGNNNFSSRGVTITATGNQLSLSDGTGYVLRVTGDSFVDSDKAAITFTTNGADTAHFSSDATLWLNKSTGFFNNSGSYDFTTLLRTGDFYMDSLKFAFVSASGAATNFAIDLTIREYSGAASKIIANTGALRMNASDFIKHTSMDGRDYLETELDVGVVLKGGTYSYDIFTTIATGNSVPWTGRLGINGQFIKKSYTDFLTGGA